MKKLKFIDLFAGIGGFHTALARLGGECVYACEIDPDLRDLYKKNYGIYPDGDIKGVVSKDIPFHNVACAGFPCVSYSVAGSQLGHKCPQWGNLVNYALDLIFDKRSEYIILENVENLVRSNSGKDLEIILHKIQEEGYRTDYRVFSPHEFGIPQHRKRIYIVATRKNLDNFKWPEPAKFSLNMGRRFLRHSGNNFRLLEKAKEDALSLWQILVRNLSPTDSGLGGVIFAAECGATYPYDIDFQKEPVRNLRKYKGAYGTDLSECHTRKDLYEKLPPYTINTNGKLPRWKKEAIFHSRNIFKKYKTSLPKNWANRIKSLGYNSWQRLEWRGERGNFDIWSGIIQFRPSGIRIFKKSRFPCFVAINSTQTPILGWKKRYVNSSEALKLQGMGELKYNTGNESQMMRAVGNAVNAHIVYSIAHNLIGEFENA